MPMKTTLRTRACRASLNAAAWSTTVAPPSLLDDARRSSSATRYSTRLACRSCSTISPADRSPTMPIVPVAQKVHPIAHPTCDDTHTVVRLQCRITTVSTRSPSQSRTASLVVSPSCDSSRASTCDEETTNCDWSRALAAEGRDLSSTADVQCSPASSHEQTSGCRSSQPRSG